MITLNGVTITPTIFPDKTSQVWKVPEAALRGPSQIVWKFEHEAEFLHLAQLVDLLHAIGGWCHLVLPYGRHRESPGCAPRGDDVKERPILFSGEMVSAIRDGRKTQTRRVVKPQPAYPDSFDGMRRVVVGRELQWFVGGAPLPYTTRDCSCGAPGDRLWVRETFALSQADPDFAADTRNPADWDPVVYRADGEEQGGGWTDADGNTIKPPWRPSIHMPRWASRITLDVVSVRVERLRDISEEDAVAEGIEMTDAGPPRAFRHYTDSSEYVIGVDARASYRTLWEHINGPGSWVANPWVWVVEFRRVTT